MRYAKYVPCVCLYRKDRNEGVSGHAIVWFELIS